MGRRRRTWASSWDPTTAPPDPVHRGRPADLGRDPNDDFAAPEAVAADAFFGTTQGATTEADEVAAGVAAEGDGTLWYSWVAAATGDVYVVWDSRDG